MIQCPECGSTTWMRATRVVEFAPRSWLTRWWLGAVRERLIGYNGVCAQCGTAARVDGNGAKRLGPLVAQSKGRQDDAPRVPVAPEPRPAHAEPIEIHRTPGMVWTRPER
jgi:hypothetical protein